MQKSRSKSGTTRNQKDTSKKSQAKKKDSDQESSRANSRVTRNTRSGARQKSAQRGQSQTEVVYEKGAYIAFVDPSENLETYKIAQLIGDLRDVDEEVQVNVFNEMAAMEFKKVAAKKSLYEYQIITDIQVTQVAGQKKTDVVVKINKQQHNKIIKLMDAVVAKLDKEKEDDEDEEEDDDDESEKEESEEEFKKDTPKDIKSRKIVKATKKESPLRVSKSQNKKPEKKSQKKAEPAKSKSAAKRGASKEDKEEEKVPANVKRVATRKSKRKEEAEQDEDMLEEESKVDQKQDEEEEQDASEHQIDTTKKKGAKGKGSKKLEVPKVGTKRQRKSKKGSQEDDEGDGEEDEGNSEEQDESVVKKRKVSKGKSQVVKTPKKKVPKRPTEFKKGKWNPDIELLDEDKYRESKNNDLYLDCCIRCNNKNIIRASNSNNIELLKKGIAAKKKISSLCAYWSAESLTTAVDIITKKNQEQFLELMFHPNLTVPLHSDYNQERAKWFRDRVGNPQYLLSIVDSGMVSHMAYGARVRKVQITRGNRQGNNAFLDYRDPEYSDPMQYITSEIFSKKLMYAPEIKISTVQALVKLYPYFENTIYSYLYEAVRAGNRSIAHDTIKKLVKLPNWGFNQLHCDVLGDNDKLEKFVKASVTKKCNTNKDITPLHCACINPNGKFLKQLLDVSPEINNIDQDLRRPIHYAAACVGSEPLQVLIDFGANLNDLDNQKTTCLHIAAMFGRHENIDLILKTSANLLNLRNKKGMSALAYACKYGHTKAVEVLLRHKAKLNFGVGQARMPPIIWAAAYGHYELVEFLLENKARVLSKDKFKRTALIMAVRNGYSKIASLLLQRGSEWNHQDSSMNTPLHYAAAYGWLDCIDLLLKSGADVNSTNSWKITPINIAMLLNHQGCVKRILEQPNVDVNVKDEKGRTLLTLSMLKLDEETYDFVKYLLEKKANPNIVDLEGQGPLHYLAKYNPFNHAQGIDQDAKKRDYEKQIEIQKKLTTLLINKEADLAVKDNEGNTPFAICLSSDNAPLLELLQDKVSINKEPELLFAFSKKIFNVHYQQILLKLLKNDKPTKETMNFLNSEGMTPFLRFIQEFCLQYTQLLTLMQQIVNKQSFTYGSNERDYQIENKHLFDKFSDQALYHTYNPSLSNELKVEIARKFMEKVVIKPFQDTLLVLIDNGADAHAQVGKLKKYREEEIAKRALIAQLADGQQPLKIAEEKVKKRDEIMKERRQQRQMYGGRGKKAARYGGQQANQWGQPAVYEQPEEDPNEKEEIYDKREGEKVLREYSQNGLKNAIHLIITNPVPPMFDFLHKLKINFDAVDYDQRTPFNLLSKDYGTERDIQLQAYTKLLELEVRFDFPDINGRTPFLNFYEKQNFTHSYEMLLNGANVNQMDTSGLFALKYALIRRSNGEIQKLIDNGANVNQIDNKGRNLLHHAVNMSSATADATFETEQFLIDKGVNLNLRDQKNRTPLHYAFVKIQNWNIASQIDPIETVSSLCGCKGLELDVPDKWQKTPLHYAAQRGSSICAIYLIKRGANLESKDIYINTPLGVALLNQHYNFGIILIQNQIKSSVTPLVHKENPEKIKKMWEEEEKKKNSHKLNGTANKSKNKAIQDDVIMEDEDKNEKAAKKKHRSMFNQKPQYMNDQYGSEYDVEEENEDYGEEEDDQMIHQEFIFNQQNAFGMNVFKTPAQPASVFGFGGAGGMFSQPAQALGGFNLGNAQVQKQLQDQINSGYLPKDDEGVSMFKLAIRGGQQGLAYLMLDNGYDLMLAMQDAMDEKKFLLVLTLLSKVPDDSVVQQVNSKQQNLFHILSMNAGGCSFEHLQRIYDTLKKRGVNVQAKDVFARTALHYAVKSQCLQLVQLLVDSHEYKLNEIDVDGHSPLSYCLRGKNASQLFYNRTYPIHNIFFHLIKKGADPNIVYPEELYQPAHKQEELASKSGYDSKIYCCPIIINVIRQQVEFGTTQENIVGLLEHGAKLNVLDSDGRDPVMYAIIQDDISLLKLLLENKQVSSLNKNCQDRAGKSAAHYVVNPIRFGSYENVEILRILHKHGFNLKLKDSAGRIPSSYASEQESGVLLKELIKLGAGDDNLGGFKRTISMIPTNQWPPLRVDFEVDSDEFIKAAEDKEKREAKELKKKIPVDPTGKFEKSYEVYYGENDLPWDCYLTKVDLKNGIYGDYVFYKMQMLYDTNRDLYVVLTRWGRIGETGMNQRTPFNNLDEAKKEFKNIFKTKTGGNNFEELHNFNRVKKKYNLSKVNYITVDYKDYLAPFDYEKCPKTRIHKSIYELFEEICNITMYQRAMTTFGLDTSVMPFSAVKKDVLLEARQLLMEITETIKEDIEVSKQGINADYDTLSAIKERISDLSSRYYELIPHKAYHNAIAPPLQYQHQVQQQYQNLESLTNIEFASKMLLGALYRQKELNPIDYVYQALNLQIENVELNSPEYDVIKTYIANTREQNYQSDQYEVTNIFKVQRKGEAEMIQSYKELPNHFLLYHGSKLFNFLGILNQGLRIAPPEAPPTGYMFGKGVYFADMFDKSVQYALGGYQQQESFLMLMCEVALGNMKELRQAEYVEKLEPQYNSVKGMGRRGPEYKHLITLPNGVKIPYGKVTDYYKDKPNVYNQFNLAHNEFIVYKENQIRMRYLIQIKRKDLIKKK